MAESYHPVMDSKTEVGQENIYFEMESKPEDDAGTYDDIIPRNDHPQEKPKVEAQLYEDFATMKHHRLFFIASAIAVASLLTALATLVLAVVMMASRSEVSTEMSEIMKNLQELKKNFSAVRESSVSENLRELEATLAEMKRELENVKSKGENTAEFWFFLNGTVHEKFFDFKKQIDQLDQKGKNTKDLWLFLNGTVHEKFLDFQKQIVQMDQEVKNVSKMPGPIGPPGYNGSQGPAGRNGSDFSACDFKTRSESRHPGTNRVLVHLDEPPNKRIMAVTCSTDYNAEYNIISRMQGDGARRYVCTCDGKSTFFTRGSSCYLNYWICPLTT